MGVSSNLTGMGTMSSCQESMSEIAFAQFAISHIKHRNKIAKPPESDSGGGVPYVETMARSLLDGSTNGQGMSKPLKVVEQ